MAAALASGHIPLHGPLLTIINLMVSVNNSMAWAGKRHVYLLGSHATSDAEHASKLRIADMIPAASVLRSAACGCRCAPLMLLWQLCLLPLLTMLASAIHCSPLR